MPEAITTIDLGGEDDPFFEGTILGWRHTPPKPPPVPPAPVTIKKVPEQVIKKAVPAQKPVKGRKK